MTKAIHDDLKCSLPLDDAKVELMPQIIDNSIVIGTSDVISKPKGKVKVGLVKTKMTIKKGRIEKISSHLYDLEECAGPERHLNVELDLYQMEDY